MTSRRRILITGATGNVGGAVIRTVKNDPTIELVAAVRDPAKAAHLGVATVSVDFDKPETIAPALQGIDALFLMTGYTVDMLN